jgi:putative flippase GtrA
MRVPSFLDVVGKLTDGYAEKGVKFLTVSAFNVVFGQCLLVLANAGFGWSFVPSNFFAVGISAGPAYVLSRYWVWQKRGKSHFWKEVVPFWGLAFLGLVISTILVAMAENYSDMTLVLMGTNLLAFGCVWVAKFFILDRVLFRQDPILTDAPAPAGPTRRSGLRTRIDGGG